MVQYSYSANAQEGGDPGKLKLDIPRFTDIRPHGFGSWMGNLLLHKYASMYGTDMLFMSLDHFTSPELDKVNPSLEGKLGSHDYEVAKAKIAHAAKSLAPILGKVAEIDEKTLNAYIGYMLSPEYQSYRADFLAAVRFGNPAWAMIDTGALPTVLNFATSRDLAGAVRNELHNKDVMIEAELSATGQSGEEGAYKYWKTINAPEQETERRLVTLFVKYTGADAIAYEIGMEHAAKSGEAHEPDEEKLRDIQLTLYKETSRHIPFAQHGGTGSSRIIRGLVGKYNVNTAYLHAGAMAELARCEKMGPDIRGRVKKAIGTDRMLAEIAAVRAVAEDYLHQTDTFGMSPELRKVLGVQAPALPTYSAFDIKATE